jgi:hypothetical protein
MLWLDLETWEMLSYVVTVIALPGAIAVFWLEQREERQNEREEIFLKLLDEYNEFAKVLIENADLCLMTGRPPSIILTAEQREKQFIIFDLLVSFFERAYILIYEDDMDKQTRRMWSTWEDYIDEWLRREDFVQSLPQLLLGEDPDFGAFIRAKLNRLPPHPLPIRPENLA